MELEFVYAQQETADISSCFFLPAGPVHFSAGQYVKLTLPHANADDRGDSRYFTLSSAPLDGLLRITTRFAERSSSFKTALRALTPGDKLEASDPSGTFLLPDGDRPVILVAGGIGITPYRSMLCDLADRGEHADLHLVYAARGVDDLVFRQELEERLEETGGSWTYVLDQGTASFPFQHGPATVEQLHELAGEDALVYLSGPKPMLNAFKEGLLAAGLDEERLKTDFFPGYE